MQRQEAGKSSLELPALGLVGANPGSRGRRSYVIEGATHIDLYDRPQFVTPAVSKLADFFGRHLA